MVGKSDKSEPTKNETVKANDMPDFLHINGRKQKLVASAYGGFVGVYSTNLNEKRVY